MKKTKSIALALAIAGAAFGLAAVIIAAGMIGQSGILQAAA